ncbi:sodium ion-translocating decarboxylase subunit beta [Oscillibacter sp. MSJ-2]|uniref:Sodium ion-translocating decarboxylase subunit beta n=1 Tax=Dysosmobacter acutus TaxID=2841504 RepID=A0ABS6F6D1_9FIRM|nr:sodium ion-translocating decarboxylase subunit beta [Dysosmobacter acutus]MBU5625815.1 sodium ion-translocating decarboxylase subunit beta [Dysosmobacter acutus]
MKSDWTRIDLSPLGLEAGSEESGYFCTPKGARIIGWAGVDGIHCCTAPGFGETIFSVSPMNAPGEYVRPLARNFRDFLSLLLSCGGFAAAEQAPGWSREQFSDFLLHNPPENPERLEALRRELDLKPMEDPFSYIQALQEEIDLSQLSAPIPSPALPPERPQEWKVFYSGGFWGRHGRERAGREIPVRKSFSWADALWQVPAVYVCGKGLVADFCARVAPERIRAFLNKWDLSPERGEPTLTDEQRMELEAENPLSLDVDTRMAVNGRALSGHHGCGIAWNPCLPEEMQEREARDILAHYGLDPSYGWILLRRSFRWATSRPPVLRSLQATLRQEPLSLPGPRFHVSGAGDSVSFTHPVTGARHTLVVDECAPQELSSDCFREEGTDVPTHLCLLRYHLLPDLPQDGFLVRDCRESDPPRPREGEAGGSGFHGAAAVGVIGGADGPVAVFAAGGANPRAACSSLRFEPPPEVEWRVEFRVRTLPEQTVDLL